MPTLVPPYAGSGWSNYQQLGTFPYIWTAYRHRPLTGEIVMQMGVHSGFTDFQIGIMKVGYQHTFKTTHAGPTKIIVDVNPGPVTNRWLSACNVEASLTGPGVSEATGARVFAFRPQSLLLEGALAANATYTVRFFGHLQIFVEAGETAYGEIITAFPRINRFGPLPGPVQPESMEAEDPRISAVKLPKPTLTKISLEEAYQAPEGFEGGTEGSPSRRRK